MMFKKKKSRKVELKKVIRPTRPISKPTEPTKINHPIKITPEKGGRHTIEVYAEDRVKRFDLNPPKQVVDWINSLV